MLEIIAAILVGVSSDDEALKVIEPILELMGSESHWNAIVAMIACCFTRKAALIRGWFGVCNQIPQNDQ